jgi:antitoxin YefM
VKSITHTAARENLANTINRVREDDSPVMITRSRDQAVVMLSLAEYESLQETAYLLRSPANAKRLITAVDALNRATFEDADQLRVWNCNGAPSALSP